MSINNHISDLSESFLHFLDDDNFNKNRQTFCEEKSNSYHDSSYIWCKVCNKIYCTRCSLNHLINNQIDHTPSDKVFLRKEHFDVEFNRECDRLNEIKKNIDELFNNNNKENNQTDYKELYETLSLLMKYARQLTEAIDDFQKKIKTVLDNIQNKYKNAGANLLKEENVRSHFKEICAKFKMIEKNYYNSQPFLPTQLKYYYDNLSSGYDDCRKLNELMKKNKSNNNNFSSEISDECNKYKIILNNAINQIKGCKVNFDKLLNDIKI